MIDPKPPTANALNRMVCVSHWYSEQYWATYSFVPVEQFLTRILGRAGKSAVDVLHKTIELVRA